MWRCRGNCRNQVPYFGFMWLTAANREPNRESDAKHFTWMEEGCDHQFERYSDAEHPDPNQWLSVRDCVNIFNEFVRAKKIQIRTNAHFTNYDDDTGTFISVEEFFPELYSSLGELNRIVCIICFRTVAEENVIQHLFDCSGLTYSVYRPLPLLMINKSDQR